LGACKSILTWLAWTCGALLNKFRDLKNVFSKFVDLYDTTLTSLRSVGAFNSKIIVKCWAVRAYPIVSQKSLGKVMSFPSD
jgi:hypothetical protein